MTGNHRNSVIVFAGLTSAFLIVRFAFSFFPESRLWGFNQTAFLPGLTWIYPVCLLAVGALVAHSLRASSKPESAETRALPGGMRLLFLILIPVLSGVWFYLFRARAHFLGDGYQIIANPELPIKTLEYGEALFHHWLLAVFTSGAADDVKPVYQLVASVSGVGFMAVWLYYGSRLTRTRSELVVFAALGFLLPHTLLYYGYVENYSLVATVLSAAVLSGMVSLYRRKRSVTPLLFFGLAVALHTVSLVYLPAFAAYLLMVASGRFRRLAAAYPGKTVFGLAAVLCIAVYAAKTWGPLFWRLAFLPILPDEFTTDNYYLFSTGHILDYVNLLFLLAPIAIMVFMFGLIVRRKWTLAEEMPSAGVFLAVAAISGLVGAFCIEPKLGMARDWDLLSTMVIAAAIGGVVFAVKEFATGRGGRTIAAMLMIAGLAVFIPWLGLHISPDGMKEYAMNVMRLDPKHSRSGFHVIGSLAEARGDTIGARRIQNYIRYQYPEKELEQRGAYWYRLRQFDTAAVYFREAIERNPSWYTPYQKLGMCQVVVGDYDEALRNLSLADGLNPYNAVTYAYLGDACMGIGDSSRALEFWHKSLDTDTTLAEPKLSLGKYHVQRHEPDTALDYLNSLDRVAVPPEAFYWRGAARMMIGDFNGAKEQFSLYLERGRNEALRQKARDALRTLTEGTGR